MKESLQVVVVLLWAVIFTRWTLTSPPCAPLTTTMCAMNHEAQCAKGAIHARNSETLVGLERLKTRGLLGKWKP